MSTELALLITVILLIVANILVCIALYIERKARKMRAGIGSDEQKSELAQVREELEGVRRALDRLNDTIHEDLLQKDNVFLGEINQDNVNSF